MTDIKFTRDLDNLFFPKLDEIGAELVADPRHLLSVMMSESGVKASAHNPNGHASGLIQFMPDTLAMLGWTHGHEAFRRLSATDQLPFVRRYFSPHRGLLKSIAAVYVATFLPAFVSRSDNPDFVLTAKDGPLGWAYAPNAVFDQDHNYAITVRELGEAVARNCRGPRWAEIVMRLEDGQPPQDPELVEEGFDLSTTLGIQRALVFLGFNPGPVDGVPGPLTVMAIRAFQAADGSLDVDGICGPKTRAALETTIKTRA